MEHQVVALLGLRVRAETQLGDEGNNAVLSGPDPLAAQVDPRRGASRCRSARRHARASITTTVRPASASTWPRSTLGEPHHHHVDVLVGHTVLLRCVGIERT